MKKAIMIFYVIVACSGIVCGEKTVQVSAPQDVAPLVEGTRSQSWGAIGWNGENKVWLVVWREGVLNEETTDIWCGRVSAEGQPLDRGGVRLSSGPGLKLHPRVASDGKGWLVVWDDMGNGKDFDIRAVRVSADGKKAGEVFTIADGEHNQCYPDICFAGGVYHVVWQGFMGSGIPGTKGTGYCLYGIRVSSDGRLLEEKPRVLMGTDKYQSAYPYVVPADDVVLVTFQMTTGSEWGGAYLNRIFLDSSTGEVKIGPILKGKKEAVKTFRNLGDKITARGAPAAYDGNKFIVLTRSTEGFGGRNPYEGNVLTITKSGEVSEEKPVCVLKGSDTSRFWHHNPPVSAMCFDGENFLVVAEYKGGKDETKTRLEIRGWVILPSGVIDGSANGFRIAPCEQYEQMLPAVCGGPKGVSLVVNSELRGVDDLKLVCRVVKIIGGN
jgi:hypothetical protein